MRTNEELLAEIEAETGPDPVYSVGPELAELAVATIRARAAEDAVAEAVAKAREAGQTWQAIGDVLGMTRQGALKRFRVA